MILFRLRCISKRLAFKSVKRIDSIKDQILTDTIINDGIPFRDHRLSFYGSYLYLYSPDKSHLIYQESIKQLKHEMKLKDEKIEVLK